MAERYEHLEIEQKWQKRWQDEGVFRVTNGGGKKQYVLDMFPYPSGDGLHVGHPEGYTATDIYSRFLRMNGYSVLHPMGWDAFGLPAENYAIKQGVHPSVITQKNIANFKRQIQSLGFSYDWEREVDTTDPKYYKWTQWIFLQLFKAGLAYEQEAPIWWCPKDKTGLANEEVVNGKCDRCGTTVEKKMLKQWMLKITAYADRLLSGLDDLDWPEGIKTLQRNWIGKSEGAEVDFEIETLNQVQGDKLSVTVFTTRPDTLFGATYLVLAPEHALVEKITTAEQRDAVQLYIKSVAAKSDLERTSLEKEKTGVFTGAFAINPVNQEKIPVWIADYVLASYGTGAIMAVPAHDERDFAFAKKFELPIREVVAPVFITKEGADAVRADKPTVRRKTAYAFLKHTSEDKYLCLDWEKYNWHSGIIGGIEDGEDAVEAAKREIHEETGYKNLELIQDLGPIDGYYYAGHKEENRYAIGRGLVFKLLDEVQDLVNPEETKHHTAIWVEGKDMGNWLNLPNYLYLWEKMESGNSCYSGDGSLMNSEQFDSLSSVEARKKIVETLEKAGKARPKVQYKLRDWVFSRQRYWGEPIPLIHCENCGIVPVPEDQLPVQLPTVEKYEPTGTGESPLAAISTWVHTRCPNCCESARRETNTMPQWAGSCWYYLRFCDPKNEKGFASASAMKAWLPVDMYVGGAEHAVLHLLYARFWHKVLFDAGHIPAEVGDEPFKKLKNQGLILGTDGEKMSKSRGNVINPDDIITEFGADTFRMYEMFMGPFEDAKPWNTNGLIGVRRFLEKVIRASERLNDTEPNIRWHKYVQSITAGVQGFRFNTCVSDFMKWVNEFGSEGVSRTEFSVFLQTLSPFAPHLAEELWAGMGNKTLIAQASWPTFDPTKVQAERVTIAVQVMGKLRATLSVVPGLSQEEVVALAKAEENVKKFLTNDPKKTIFVQDKLVNFVV